MKGLVVVATLTLSLALPPSARATGGIVLESHVGPRPADMARHVEPFLDELARAGYLVGPARLGARIEDRLSRPSVPLDDAAVAALLGAVDAGYASWLRGEFERAADRLALAVERFHRSPRVLIQDQTLRWPLLKALVGLALAHGRLGRPEAARRVMAQVVRAFRDHDPTRTIYGPEAAELHRRVRDDLARQGTAELEVVVDDERAVVFVDERYAGVGAARLTELLPGRYRVYVQKGSAPGRLHVLDLGGGGRARLRLDWCLESALRTERDWVGLAFPTDAARRAEEARLAREVARALGHDEVVLVTIGSRHGRRALLATILRAPPARPVVAALPLEPEEPSAWQLRGLARFVAHRERPGAIEVLADAPPSTERARREEADEAGPWTWITAGGAVAAAAFGVALLVVDGDCTTAPPDGAACPYHYDTTVPGVALTATGAALTGLATFLFWSERGPRRPVRKEARGAARARGLAPAWAAAGLASDGAWVAAAWDL